MIRWLVLVVCAFATGLCGVHAAPGVRVPFQFIDNRIFIPVSLNGQGPYSFVLDTGSSDWDVSHEIAGQLGLEPEGTQTIWGAGEGKVESNTLHVAETGVGSARFRNQLFDSTDFSILNRVIGFTHFDGIAGVPVFRSYAVGIDFDRGFVQLMAPAAYTPPAGAIRVPFTTPDGSTPLVSGRIVGVAGNFIVDTGDRSSLTLFGPFWRAHGLDKKLAPTLNALTGYGVGGPIRGLIVRVPHFEFGGAQANDVVARLSLQKSGGFADPFIAGSIGSGLLRRFHVTFDYAHKQIVLQPGAGFAKPDRFDRAGLWLGRGAAGFEIYDVIADGPAAHAGLRTGDTIVAVDGKPISHIDLFALRARLADPRAGNIVSVAYRRGKTDAKAKLSLRDLLPGPG